MGIAIRILHEQLHEYGYELNILPVDIACEIMFQQSMFPNVELEYTVTVTPVRYTHIYFSSSVSEKACLPQYNQYESPSFLMKANHTTYDVFSTRTNKNSSFYTEIF